MAVILLMNFNILFTIVTNETGVTIDQLISKSREKKYVRARILLVYLARKQGYSYPSIGKELNRDHSSIINLFRLAKKNPFFEETYLKAFLKYKIIDQKIAVKNKGLTTKYSRIYEKFGGKCVICGFESVVEVHHIIPKSLGGNDEPDNLLLFCPNHHAMADRGLIKLSDIKPNECFGYPQ